MEDGFAAVAEVMRRRRRGRVVCSGAAALQDEE